MDKIISLTNFWSRKFIGNFKAGNSSLIVPNKQDWLGLIQSEGNKPVLIGLMLINWQISILSNIKNVKFLERKGNKNRTAKGAPNNVYDSLSHLKAKQSLLLLNSPNFDVPVSRGRDENIRVEHIKHHSIDSQIVSIVGFLIIARIGRRAEMDVSLLCSNQKLKLTERREVEAGRIGQRSVLDFQGFILLLFGDQL